MYTGQNGGQKDILFASVGQFSLIDTFHVYVRSFLSVYAKHRLSGLHITAGVLRSDSGVLTASDVGHGHWSGSQNEIAAVL